MASLQKYKKCIIIHFTFFIGAKKVDDNVVTYKVMIMKE